MLRKILILFKPLVWKIAKFYDIKVEYHCLPQGPNEVIIEGGDLQKNHMIPKSVYFNTGSGKIVVGKDTAFGEDVKLLTGMHFDIRSEEVNTGDHQGVPKEGRDIEIGQGCYIGSNVIIIGPCKIGEYSVIVSGSIVNKDIPDRSFVSGPIAKIMDRF